MEGERDGVINQEYVHGCQRHRSSIFEIFRDLHTLSCCYKSHKIQIRNNERRKKEKREREREKPWMSPSSSGTSTVRPITLPAVPSSKKKTECASSQLASGSGEPSRAPSRPRCATSSGYGNFHPLRVSTGPWIRGFGSQVFYRRSKRRR